MAIVTSISEQAEKVLREKGIHYKYGYGDAAYHFRGVPGTSSVDIEDAFTLGDTSFIVKGEQLLLTKELETAEREYSDIAVFTNETMQVTLRVADPENKEQITRAVEAVFYGLASICTLNDLLGMQKKAQQVLDEMK